MLFGKIHQQHVYDDSHILSLPLGAIISHKQIHLVCCTTEFFIERYKTFVLYNFLSCCSSALRPTTIAADLLEGARFHSQYHLVPGPPAV